MSLLLQIGHKTLPHYRVNLPYGLNQESFKDDISNPTPGEIQLQIPTQNTSRPDVSRHSDATQVKVISSGIVTD